MRAWALPGVVLVLLAVVQAAAEQPAQAEDSAVDLSMDVACGPLTLGSASPATGLDLQRVDLGLGASLDITIHLAALPPAGSESFYSLALAKTYLGVYASSDGIDAFAATAHHVAGTWTYRLAIGNETFTVTGHAEDARIGIAVPLDRVNGGPGESYRLESVAGLAAEGQCHDLLDPGEDTYVQMPGGVPPDFDPKPLQAAGNADALFLWVMAGLGAALAALIVLAWVLRRRMRD